MPPIERTGTSSVTQAQAQQNTNAAETIGQLGPRTVRQGKADGSGLTIKSALTKIADFLRAGFEEFKSLHSRSVSAGQADTARVAAGKPDLSNFPLDYSYNLQEAQANTDTPADTE